MLNYLADKYKSFTKQQYFDQALGSKKKYAFVGTGRHAIAQLYPVLQHLGISLKYIYSKKIENAKAMCAIYKGAVAAASIEEIANDKEIAGVFICTLPLQHFEIASTFLRAGKHIFIEKPPCATVLQLEQLIQLQSNQVIHVNFQQRYSPAIQLLQKQAADAKFYNHEYLTGLFTEGEPLVELFIHSLDIILQLFGTVTSFNCQKITTGKTVTYLIQTLHQNGAVGQVKLSTAYSWQNATEIFELHTGKQIISCNIPYFVKRISMPATVAGVPLEKLFKQPTTEEILLNGHTIDTSLKNHSSYLQGFYHSIKTFVTEVEKKEPVIKSIHELKPLYNWIETLRKK